MQMLEACGNRDSELLLSCDMMEAFFRELSCHPVDHSRVGFDDVHAGSQDYLAGKPIWDRLRRVFLLFEQCIGSHHKVSRMH